MKYEVKRSAFSKNRKKMFNCSLAIILIVFWSVKAGNGCIIFSNMFAYYFHSFFPLENSFCCALYEEILCPLGFWSNLTFKPVSNPEGGEKCHGAEELLKKKGWGQAELTVKITP